MKTFLLLLSLSIAALGVDAQVQWAEDASAASIPAVQASGTINGKAATLKFADIGKTGYMNVGDTSFDLYTVRLRDSDNFIKSAFSVDVVLTVRKGEHPAGKTFRRISSSELAKQPGFKGDGVLALADFYSLSMASRRDAKPGQDPFFAGEDWIRSDQPFTGRLELGDRNGDKLPARIYVCFADKLKSCVAGNVEVSFR